ncbi:MAG: cardiolipin [Planctomycetota bacterium]|nr:MAG: cardiolipin [Planctomycetota bacterium]
MPFAMPTVPPEIQVAIAILAAVQVLLVVTATAHALMWRREPRAAALWIAISLLVPLIGPLLYFVLGINRTARLAKRKFQRRRATERRDAPDVSERASTVGDLEPLARLVDRIGVEPLVAGNRIEPLWDGEEAFPAMLEAIAGAKKSIALCSYIFDCDETGHQFADALAAAGARGAKVKLLVDAVGAGSSVSRLGRVLRKRRLQVRSFSPLGFSPARLLRFNLRNHRKILVVDGETAFSGGINISARHISGSSQPGRCRDVHFRIRGSVVAQVMRAFAEDWQFAAGEALEGDQWFPAPVPCGATMARGIGSGPDQDLERIYWTILGACSAAKKSIRIVTPYFIPEQGLKHAIMTAALEGIEVSLVLPEATDHRVVHWATCAYLWELIQAGVTVVRTPPPFDHSKLIIVDRRWALFGSANLDPRSLRLNFEYNLEAYDPALCETLSTHYESLAEKGRKVTLKDVDGRSTIVRLRDGAAKLFSPYL